MYICFPKNIPLYEVNKTRLESFLLFVGIVLHKSFIQFLYLRILNHKLLLNLHFPAAVVVVTYAVYHSVVAYWQKVNFKHLYFEEQALLTNPFLLVFVAIPSLASQTTFQFLI